MYWNTCFFFVFLSSIQVEAPPVSYTPVQPSPPLSSMDDYDVPPVRKQPSAPKHTTPIPPVTQAVQSAPVPHGQMTTPGRRTPPGHELYDTPPSALRISPSDTYDIPSSSFGSGESLSMRVGQSSPKQDGNELYDTPPVKHDVSSQNLSVDDLYDVPPSAQKRMNVEKSPSVSPQDSVDTYDVPPSQSSQLSESDLYDIIPPLKGGPQLSPPNEHYDTLPQRTQPQRLYDTQVPRDTSTDIYDVPPSAQTQNELYDVPARLGHEIYDEPPSARGLRPVAGALQKRISDHVYDIPPTVTQDRPVGGAVMITQHYRSADDITDGMSKLTLPQLSKSADCIDDSLGRRLNLDRDAAMDLLVKRQQALDSAGAYMLSYVSSTWRHHTSLEPHIHEIRAACNQLKLAFKEFMEFCDGVLVNALHVSDQNLHEKLSKHCNPIQEKHQVMTKASGMLDEMNWEVGKLIFQPGDNSTCELDTFAVTARGLPEDVKRFVIFVQANAPLLFKRAGVNQNRPLPTPPPSAPGMSSNWMAPEKESFVTTAPIQATTIRTRPLPVVPSVPVVSHQAHTNGSTALPENGIMPENGYIMKPQSVGSQQLIINTDHPPISPPPVLSPGDQQLLTFYYTEVETLFTALHNAIDLFFSCIDGNQPPKVFVAHSKHIILLGHKLVFVGDTLHHNLHNMEVRSKIIHHSDLLCDCLNVSVNATKNAALQFPAVQPLQEMVDRITDVAAASRDLKETIMLNTPVWWALTHGSPK